MPEPAEAAPPRRADRIAVVLKGYPRLSETFVAQELLELERAGFTLDIFSMRHPTDTRRHPVHEEISARVTYLPEYLHHDPRRVLSAWRRLRRRPGYKAALSAWLADLRRDPTPNRARRFGQALVLAAEFPPEASWIYAHFLHTPASVARYAHLILGLPWSVSAHAKDIWTTPDWEISEKLGSARFAVTCTAVGHGHLARLAPDAQRVSLVYHGIDLDRFGEAPPHEAMRDGRSGEEAVRLLTIGRAVAKKGLDTLIDALALLPADFHWHWTHIGGGELAGAMREQIARLKLPESRIRLAGSQPQSAVLAAYRDADIFVLPSRITASGDRDGLPNVLVEAASQGLTSIATPISGIVELIADGENGVLVDPDDPQALASAILALGRDPARRRRLGERAAMKARGAFSHRGTIGRLISLFAENGVLPVSRQAERHLAAE